MRLHRAPFQRFKVQVLNCTREVLFPEDTVKERVMADGEEGGTLYDFEGMKFMDEEKQMEVLDLDLSSLIDAKKPFILERQGGRR